MRASPALLALAVLMLTLSGCSGWPDGEEARTCRQAAAILNPPDAGIELRDTSTIGAGPARGIQLVYVLRRTGMADHVGILTCRFAGAGATARERLSGIFHEGSPVGPLRLAMLKRFWLASADASADDPAPYLRSGRVVELPFPLAYGLQLSLSALPMTAIYAMLAAAYALVFGLVGRIVLAFGELAALGGYVTTIAVIGTLAAAGSAALAIAIALALVLATLAWHAAAGSRRVLLPLVRASGQHALIGTVGLALALQEYLRIAQGTTATWIPPLHNQAIAVAQSGRFVVTFTPISLVVAAAAAVAALALVTLLRRSRFGHAWRASADDPLAAELLGIDPDATTRTSLLIAACLAGLAGLMMTLFYGSVGYAGGVALGLKALIGAVIGGIGSVPGALLGGLVVGAVETTWSALFAIEHRDLVLFALLAAFLIWRPQGLLGASGEAHRRR